MPKPLPVREEDGDVLSPLRQVAHAKRRQARMRKAAVASEKLRRKAEDESAGDRLRSLRELGVCEMQAALSACMLCLSADYMAPLWVQETSASTKESFITRCCTTRERWRSHQTTRACSATVPLHSAAFRCTRRLCVTPWYVAACSVTAS
jgi:hypothetical protein